MIRKPRVSKARSEWLATLRVGDWVRLWDALLGSHVSQTYDVDGVLTVDTHPIGDNGIIDRNRWICPATPEEVTIAKMDQRKQMVRAKAVAVLCGLHFRSLTEEDCEDLARVIDRHAKPKPGRKGGRR